jgi:uncharacterized Zn-binding protein involved in type VI secretion
MGQPAAKQGDQVTGQCTHTVSNPATGATVQAPLPFAGQITGGLAATVNIMSKPAATVGSTADNSPPHVPPAGTTFVTPPTNQATVNAGSQTVNIGGRPAARNGDKALLCTEVPSPGTVVATGTVMLG